MKFSLLFLGRMFLAAIGGMILLAILSITVFFLKAGIMFAVIIGGFIGGLLFIWLLKKIFSK